MPTPQSTHRDVMVVGAGFQPALQTRSSREIATTKSDNPQATRYPLSIATALRVFAMDALGGLCDSTLRWCDVICVICGLRCCDELSASICVICGNSVAMVRRVKNAMPFAMIFAILAFFAVQQRCCDGICVYPRYLRYFRPRAPYATACSSVTTSPSRISTTRPARFARV